MLWELSFYIVLIIIGHILLQILFRVCLMPHLADNPNCCRISPSGTLFWWNAISIEFVWHLQHASPPSMIFQNLKYLENCNIYSSNNIAYNLKLHKTRLWVSSPVSWGLLSVILLERLLASLTWLVYNFYFDGIFINNEKEYIWALGSFAAVPSNIY